jgi:hypothetical protein
MMRCSERRIVLHWQADSEARFSHHWGDKEHGEPEPVRVTQEEAAVGPLRRSHCSSCMCRLLGCIPQGGAVADIFCFISGCVSSLLPSP